jgi:hypothetical protein
VPWVWLSVLAFDIVIVRKLIKERRTMEGEKRGREGLSLCLTSLCVVMDFFFFFFQK